MKPKAALALFLLAGLALAQDCGDWNTAFFFSRVAAADVKACLETGADLEARDNNGRTPLFVAARHSSDPGIFAVLLEAGARVGARNRDGRTPLHFAAQHQEDPAIISALLEAGADVNARNVRDQTPLHFAATYNSNLAVITVLLSAGAGAGQPFHDQDGLTPTAAAIVRNNHIEIIRTLFEDGGSRGLIGTSTLLLQAAQSNPNPDVVIMLLDAGADVNVKTGGLQGPLHLAARYNDNPDVITVLLDAGADGSAQDTEGNTPWDYAHLRESDFSNKKDVFWRLGEARFE